MRNNFMEDWKFKAKTPRGVATEIKKYLERDCQATDVFVWNPTKSKEMGYSGFWAVVSEDAPFEWAASLTGWNSDIANHSFVFAEPQNGWMLCLSKRSEKGE